MNNLLNKAKSLFPFGSRKRKRSPEDEADEKVASKVMRLEERYADLQDIISDSETEGEFEDYTLYNINDMLVEQDKMFLLKDPYGSNFLAATWSNEGTLLRKDAPISKWTPRLAYFESDIFPEEVFAEILSHCEPSSLAAMMRVSMSVNRMLHNNQMIWRKLFYRRHWRLKHEIENNFVGTEPDVFVDKSNWVNFVPDNQVDWFGEYKRNHINAKIIKNTIEEIKLKLQRFVNAFAEVKEGVTDPLFFEPGVTDEQIDDRIVMDGIPITNDLRELLKCCNGTRFLFDHTIDEYYYYESSSIFFPCLEKLSVGPYTMQHFLSKGDRSYLYLDDEYDSPVEYLETDEVPQEQRSAKQTPKLVTDASEVQSDSEEYSMSGQESMEGEEEIKTSADDQQSNGQIPNDKLILFNHIWSEYSPQQVYCPQTGSIDHFNCDAEEPIDSFSSIISYLQHVSDYLDSGHSVKWLKFDDYVVGEYDDDDGWLHWINEPWNFGTPGQSLTSFVWNNVIDELLWDHSESLTMLPRGRKLLYAAAQDFLIKVFTKAWSLETTDTLQPGTLVEAANQLSNIFDKNYQRVTSDEGLDYDDDVDLNDC